jgi:hypothetical protein
VVWDNTGFLTAFCSAVVIAGTRYWKASQRIIAESLGMVPKTSVIALLGQVCDCLAISKNYGCIMLGHGTLVHVSIEYTIGQFKNKGTIFRNDYTILY